jgi:glycosyltransferase involved in cell wall biosynthesis
MTDSKYKGLRIALIYGKNLDGCGVTRGGHELAIWSKKVGAIVDLFAYDKKATRSAGHTDVDSIFYKENEVETIANRINENYDIAMFMSYATNKHPESYGKDFYYKMFLGITKPIKAFYVHDINAMQVDRSQYLVPMIVNTDILFHFDTDTWFSKTVDKLGFQKIGDRLHKYTLWLNFDDLDKYREKYTDENKLPGLTSVTRWSSLKNVGRSIDIMRELKELDPKQDCQVYGIERSIGAKFDIIDRPDITYVNNGSGKRDKNGPVEVYGPVTRADGLEKVASHLFASSFFSLPKAHQNYGNRMEYSQIEIAAVGTIPVFDMDWAMNNKVRDGRRYIDIPCSAIYTDGSDTKRVAELLLKMSTLPDKMKLYRDASYKVVKDEFDADTVIPAAIDLILKTGKNPVTLSVREICEKFVNKEFADEVMKIEDEGKLPVLGIGEFEKQEVHYLLNCKQVLVKKCMTKTNKALKNKEDKAERDVKERQKLLSNVKIKSLF